MAAPPACKPAAEEEGEEAAALAARLREQLFEPAAGRRPLDAEDSSEGLEPTAAQQQQQQQQQPPPPQQQQQQEQQSRAASAGAAAVDLEAAEEGREEGKEGEEDGGEVDWAARDPEGLAAALASSGAWSRVLRTPRKRSGHVLLDLCSAVEVGGRVGREGRGGVQRRAWGLMR